MHPSGLFFTAVALLVSTAGAQLAWQQLPGVGSPAYLAVAANGPGELWVSIGAGYNPAGGYQAASVMRTTNQGGTWQAINTGLPNTAVTAIGFTANGAVLAGMNRQGIYRLPTASSATWSNFSTGLPANSIPGAFIAAHGGDTLAGVGGVVYRCAATGTSWALSNTGLGSSTVNGFLKTSTAGEIFVATGGAGVYRSTNDGTSWSAMNSGLTSLNVRQLALVNGRLFAGTAAGVFVYSAQAGSWSSVSTGLTNTDVAGLAAIGDVLLAGTRGGGLFVSLNEGAAWQPAPAGVNGTLIGRVVSGPDGWLYTTGVGLYATANAGGSWQPIDPPGEYGLVRTIYSTGGRGLVAGTVNNGVYQSLNSGATWRHAGVAGGYMWDFARHPGGALFTCTNGGSPIVPVKVQRSTDNGSSWQPVNASSFIAGPAAVNGLAFAANGTGYCATFGSPSHVVRSDDGGLSWTASDLQGLPATGLAIDPAGTLFLGAEASGLWRKPAGGAWSKISGFDGTDVFKPRFLPNGDALIPMAGAGVRGVALLPAGSTTSTAVYNAGPAYDVAPLPDGAFYAGVANGVAFFPDTTAGQAGTPQNSGLPAVSVLGVCLAEDGFLYAGTGGRGAFRTALPVQPPTAPVELWRFQRFGAAEYANPNASGDLVDSERDGTVNLLEYAFNRDPKKPDTQPALVTSLQNSSGDGAPRLTATYVRRKAPRAIAYTVEFATEAAGPWASGPGLVQELAAVDDGNGVTETVTVQAVQPASAAARQFLRVRVDY